MKAMDELIEWLNAERDYLQILNNRGELTDHGITKLITFESICNKATELNKSEWVSVSERLPDKLTSVLVCGRDIRTTALFDPPSKRFYVDFKVLNHKDITHWQPLPTQPINH